MNDMVFELSGVTRLNGTNTALRNVTTHMQRGEVIGVVGPNGAGKSTLMRVLLGLVPVQSGQVRVFGTDPWQEPVAARSRIGYASDGRDDDSRATIRELQTLHRAVYPRWDDAIAQRLIGTLASKSDSRVDRLSRGEAQRVRIALAMAHRPELLLLDEPGAGLDPSLRREFLEDAVALLSESDTSIVINSHHLSDVERIASRILLLDAGNIVLDVELDTLRERYCIATFDERQLRSESGLSEREQGGVPSVAQKMNDIAADANAYVGHRSRTGELKVVLRRDADATKAQFERRGVDGHVVRPNLEELYVVLVGGNHEHS